jgi:hypothetical protein
MANTKTPLGEALNRPMDRRQFLATVGAVALGIAGVTAALKAAQQAGRETSGKGGGYGSSPYGR